MKTAIILHGMPSKEEYFDEEKPAQSNKHWLPWLQKLILKGILTQTPEMPEPYKPVYEKWQETFGRFEVNKDTVLIGHSCGAGFLVRWLSERKIKVGKVVLVAPWIDPRKELTTGFFDFVIDHELVSRTDGLTILYSTDDENVILDTVNILREQLVNAQFQEFVDKGHSCLSDMKTDKFPELLDIIVA